LLVAYLRPHRRKVALLAVLIFSSIGLQIANPQIIRYVLDEALVGGASQRLTVAALVFLGSAVLYQIISVAATYVGEDVGWAATNQLRADLARHCLRLDMAFHNERTPGQMIERIDGDVADLAIFFATLVIRILGSLLLLAGVLIVLLREDWRVSLGLALYAALTLTVLFRFRQFATPHWKASREASADLFGFLEEQLSGTEDIRSSGATDYVLHNLFKFARERLRNERVAGTMNITIVALWIGLFTLGQTIAFASGYYLHQAGLLTLGTIYLIVYYTDALYRPMRDITNEIQNLQKASASIERIQELLNMPSRLQDGTRLLPAGPLSVAFETVSFSYGERGRVLTEVSFDLQPGKVLGVLGRTGSGKTTLARLLFRLYDPDAGCICLDDSDLRAFQLDDLRGKVGMVTQDVQLFRATVRDNLTFFDTTIPDAQILRVIDDLGLAHWYETLPDGLDTELQASGKGLSAGEAQLLAFTRVFLKDPGLVILDEASSRLDPATEQLIERAVDKLLQGRTGLIIAHRLATVHRADHILILEAGRVREYGEYLDLANDPASRFYQLLQTGLEEVLA
jgi:ABC-type multidrug transport system fused ATPase/permease subunit